jgi:tyrosine-protein kinase Etk/Wzc
MKNDKITHNNVNIDRVNIRETLGYYLRYWPIILFSGFLFSVSTYLYLSSKIKVYRSESNVLVKDSKKGGLGSELDVFSDLGLSNDQSNLHNEIEVLTSRPLIRKVVESLDLNVSIYQKKGMFAPDEHFYNGMQPFFVDLSKCDSTIYDKGSLLKVIVKENKPLTIYKVSGEKEFRIGEFQLSEAIPINIGEIVLRENKSFKKFTSNEEYYVSINSIQSATSSYKSSLQISPVNNNATVLKLSITGQVPKKNEDFLNSIIQQHEEQAVLDKNEITRHTSEFIAERMKVIEEELSSVEMDGENFKTKNELVSVESNAERYLEKESSIEEQITSTVIESNLVDFMNDYLKENGQLTYLLPVNLGFTDGSINSMTTEYNELVLQRNKLIETASTANPFAIKLENRIQSIREILKISLANLKKSLNIKLTQLRQKESLYKQKLDNIPEYERLYREIARQQQIKETLYLYLLQKREENEIAIASTVGNVKVIENAFTSGWPISPQGQSSLIGAFLFGIFLPISFLYVRDKLDVKIHSREDLEGLNIPVVAEIPKSKTKDFLIVQKGNRSLVAEAFGMLRSNMKFLLPKNKDGGSVIFVSSAIAGEGKTFVAINLANSLALIDKKVVLVGMDLRAPKITRYLNIKDGMGVSDYLANDKLTVDNITVQSEELKNLDYIISGDVPPNPSELLMRPRVDVLFEELRKEYDYIIVDNAPTTLVVDAMSIVEHSDLFLYVVRANYLEKKLLDDIRIMKENEKIKNLAFILNDIDLKHSPYKGYGYGYGSNYVYGEEKKRPWYRRFIKSS